MLKLQAQVASLREAMPKTVLVKYIGYNTLDWIWPASGQDSPGQGQWLLHQVGTLAGT
jgi:hypothetical protein